MLSIIVSSYRPDFYSALEKNIAATCGIVYEMIKVYNPGAMGICAAYNIGAEKSQYEHLLFLHEDVEFVTDNWGLFLSEYLNKSNCGVVGLAGSNYVPHVPFAWWDKYENTFKNVHQFNGHQEIRNYKVSDDKEVIVVDGVFIACKKKVYHEFLFNEKIKAYHGYDIDFSTRVSEKYTNIIGHTIKLKHFSEGNPDKDWWDNIVKNRRLFKAPTKQKLDKKTELYFYKQLEKRVQLFQSSHKKIILIRYNNPRFIGYKAALRNIINIILND